MSLRTRIYMTALLLAIASHSPAQLQSTQSETKQGAAPMTQSAKGTFDVKITPQHEDKREGAALGRMSLHKVFQGEMEGSSDG